MWSTGGDHNGRSVMLVCPAVGAEHVVASPNAERAWSLETLAELAEVSGAALPVDELRASAQQIRAEVIRQLWDADAGWFRSRYPDGHNQLPPAPFNSTACRIATTRSTC